MSLRPYAASAYAAHRARRTRSGVPRPRSIARLVIDAGVEPGGRLDVLLRLRATDLGSEISEQRKLLHHPEVVSRRILRDGGRGVDVGRRRIRGVLLALVGEKGI